MNRRYLRLNSSTRNFSKMHSRFFLIITIIISGFPGFTLAQQYAFQIPNAQALQQFFRYRGDSTYIISGHRGSHISGYPENAIETFAHVLTGTPAFFEIDPRLTKDSVIVLMHDATLDRTTNGTGLLKDYTWEELKQLRLKDAAGKLTNFRIPSLQEAIDWARNKTILNLDKKDVPLQMIASLIRKNNADAFVMVTVHNAKEALFYYNDNPNRMMSAFVKTDSALHTYEQAGIPWRNLIAYIGPEYTSENLSVLNALHQRSVMCMISAAPKYDKLPDPLSRAEAYRKVFQQGADILESDYPLELAKAVKKTIRLRSPLQ